VKFIRSFGDNKLSLGKLHSSESVKIDGKAISTNRLILVDQIHSANIKVVSETDCGAGIIAEPIPGFDGLVTDQRDVYLCIKTADCIPIFLWDDERKIISALHSGRAGTEQNIAGKAVEIMKNKFRCDPRNIRVELGPAICGRCYPVDKNTFDNFVLETGIEQTQPNLNLKKVIISNLLEMGIRSNNIFDHQICTKENKNYYSFREDQTKERQVSIIGML